jgi:uncharacterized phage protein (TIGR02220 family)
LSGKPDEKRVFGKGYHPDSRTALHILNESSRRHFRETDANLSIISHRLKEPGVDIAGVRRMIERQCARWLNTEQAEYLRPETLFGKTKFDGYYASRDLPAKQQEKARNNGKTTFAQAQARQLAEMEAHANRAINYDPSKPL